MNFHSCTTYIANALVSTYHHSITHYLGLTAKLKVSSSEELLLLYYEKAKNVIIMPIKTASAIMGRVEKVTYLLCWDGNNFLEHLHNNYHVLFSRVQ